MTSARRLTEERAHQAEQAFGVTTVVSEARLLVRQPKGGDAGEGELSAPDLDPA